MLRFMVTEGFVSTFVPLQSPGNARQTLLIFFRAIFRYLQKPLRQLDIFELNQASFLPQILPKMHRLLLQLQKPLAHTFRSC